LIERPKITPLPEDRAAAIAKLKEIRRGYPDCQQREMIDQQIKKIQRKK